jgi:sec-independent protein translocase protein TatC
LAVATRPPDSQKKLDDDKRMELTEHLGELRSRIMRIILYLIGGSTVCYFMFERIYKFLFRPMLHAMNEHKTEWKIVFTHFTEAFFVVLQVSIVAGLILVAPLVIGELYGFISPALTKEEKKPLRYVVPMSVVLFILGVLLAYWVAQFAIGWFVDYVRFFPNGVLYQDPKSYVMFMLKMMAIFGAVFQLPVLLMFLAWVGLLKSAGMKKTWRHAIVGISVIGLFVTPSNDPLTMLIMIIPVMILYIGSIWLVQMIERRREKKLFGGR